MDDEKIKALAEQYAQEMYAASGRNPFTENIQSEIDNALSVMQWLSETHCIVEKEKIRTAHECEVVNWYEEQNPHLKDEFLHGRRLLESLFSKEFFNKDEK